MKKNHVPSLVGLSAPKQLRLHHSNYRPRYFIASAAMTRDYEKYCKLGKISDGRYYTPHTHIYII